MRISVWSSDVCSSDLLQHREGLRRRAARREPPGRRRRLHHRAAAAAGKGECAAGSEGAGVSTRRLYPCNCRPGACPRDPLARSEEHTSELQSLMRISYAVFCLKKKKYTHTETNYLADTQRIYQT